MILFDCERLRFPYTGFYSYSLCLGKALLQESENHKEPLGVYLPKAALQLFPEGTPHREWFHVDKHYMYLGRKISLFHASNQHSAYIPHGFRKPVLVTVHDLNYLHFPFVSEKERNLHKRKTLHGISNASRLVSISEFVKQDILEHCNLHGKSIDVVYNGVERYTGPVTAPKKLPDGPFLLSLCRVTPSKNLHTLPALLAGNDYRLVLAGKADSEDLAIYQVMEEARKWGVADRIYFVGTVNEATKHWYLKNCDAFLFPSLTEGFGLPVLEAMQYYKPIFCSDRTSLPEVGGDAVFYFNHDFEPRAMQQEFEKGMADFRSGAISREAMDARLAKFSWQNAAKAYYEIYEQMI